METIESNTECIASPKKKQELIKEIKRTMEESPHFVVSFFYLFLFDL